MRKVIFKLDTKSDTYLTIHEPAPAGCRVPSKWTFLDLCIVREACCTFFKPDNSSLRAFFFAKNPSSIEYKYYLISGDFKNGACPKGNASAYGD